MYITIEEVEKMLKVMRELPEARTFWLECDSSSGIGSILSLTVETQLNGIPGDFKVEISGVDKW